MKPSQVTSSAAKAQRLALGAGLSLATAAAVAVAGALENLTLHRSYRNALPVDQALAIISSRSGSLYDHEVVAACLRLFNEKGYKMES